uniref:Saposin B-type domain-containing protein n=1 Tax=Parastrongyloides trichosuri TaxID=131310 RepID=A0A0N4Z520_PARTI
MIHVSILLFLIVFSNFNGATNETSGKGALKFVNMISNSCSVCKLGENIVDASFPIADFQIALEEKCIITGGYKSICKNVIGKIIDVGHKHVVDFMKHHECEEFCGDNTEGISLDYACIGARYLFKNVDNFINILKSYAGDVCKNESDVLLCMNKINSILEMVKGVGKRTILRLTLNVDSKTICNLPYKELPQGEEIVANSVNNSTGEQIKCIVCAELVQFLGKITGGDGAPNTSSVQFMQALAKALTEVCDKLDLCKAGSTMCTGGTCENFAGSIVNMVPQLLPSILGKLCHTIDANCPVVTP